MDRNVADDICIPFFRYAGAINNRPIKTAVRAGARSEIVQVYKLVSCSRLFDSSLQVLSWCLTILLRLLAAAVHAFEIARTSGASNITFFETDVYAMASDKEHIQSSAEQCVPAKRKGRDDLPPRSAGEAASDSCDLRKSPREIFNLKQNRKRRTANLKNSRTAVHLSHENSPQTDKTKTRCVTAWIRIFLESKKLICMPDNSVM